VLNSSSLRVQAKRFSKQHTPPRYRYYPAFVPPSEMIQAMDAGFSILKFFPAEANGGVAALKAFSGPFPQLQFCPTGGINRSNLADYLSVNSVIAVGGSWVTPPEAVQAQDWDTITQLAKQSVTLAQTIMAAA
jgi:2-dehydro-3-deoxyphosphogluconate aldolase/(4S)-4-hydroxy-2-oxoglutarate aldolase